MSLVWAWLKLTSYVNFWTHFNADSIQGPRLPTDYVTCLLYLVSEENFVVSGGHPKSKFGFYLVVKKYSDGARHFQYFSILQSSSVNWTPGANISQLCSRNLSPDRTHSVSPTSAGTKLHWRHSDNLLRHKLGPESKQSRLKIYRQRKRKYPETETCFVLNWHKQ